MQKWSGLRGCHPSSIPTEQLLILYDLFELLRCGWLWLCLMPNCSFHGQISTVFISSVQLEWSKLELEKLNSSNKFFLALIFPTHLNGATLETGNVEEWRFVFLTLVLLFDLPFLSLQVQYRSSLENLKLKNMKILIEAQAVESYLWMVKSRRAVKRSC